MDVILIILGVLGMGAIMISAYVFTVAARNYVSNDIYAPQVSQAPPNKRHFVSRNPQDRRRHIPAQFPMTVNSVIITRDRRETGERRAAA